MNDTKKRLGLLLALGLMAAAGSSWAASTSFQSPNTAAWGNWLRGAPGTLYVHWEEFDAYSPTGFPTARSDTTPDRANLGAMSARLTPNNAGAFITGSGKGGNIYSFSDINDFDVIVRAQAGMSSGPLTVALQVSILGSDLNQDSIKLNGVGYTSKTLLATGTASAPGGSGAPDAGASGVDNEYLYLWQNVQSVGGLFLFDLRAAATSNSLDALAIDIGPMRSVSPPIVNPPPVVNPPAPVPLPGTLGLLVAGLGTFVVRARSSA